LIIYLFLLRLNSEKSVDLILSLFYKVIEAHKNAKEKCGDILDHILEGTDPNDPVSQSILLSNIFIFFVAGHETTATALNWALVELADKQEIQENLYTEIVEKFGKINPPEFNDIHGNCPENLENFMMENLRLHSPITFLPTRVATADIPYGDQVIPKGAVVAVDIANIQKHPDFWENPEKFDIDRFSKERRKGRHKFAYMPFSLGSRQCIGNEFSEIEQKLMLVRLLQRYKVLPPKDHPSRDLKKDSNITFPVPFYIRLEKR